MQPRVGESWKFCGAKFPKDERIYLCQFLMVYIVVITSIVNLYINDKITCLWSSLVSGSVGYLLPSPSISNKKEKTSFHVIIPTNSSMKTYPYNTLNHYVTALSNWIELDGDLEVALSEILSTHLMQYSKRWILSIITLANETDMFLPEGFISMDINWLIDAIEWSNIT